MTNTAAPYPSDTRAKGWRFELDYERIAQSDTWDLAPAEVRPWLLMLWFRSWSQTPCGSLPNDGRTIAAKIGAPVEFFEAHREALMRGWWTASDGRLYHPVLTERVMEMLAARKKEAGRKATQRHPAPTPNPPDLSHGTPPGHPPDSHVTPAAPPQDSTGSHGTGTGTGTSTSTQGDSIPPGPVILTEAPPKQRRPSRTAPDDFEVTAELIQWAAVKVPKLDPDTLTRETEKFRNCTFKDSKTDWAKTWRNWMLNAEERIGGLNGRAVALNPPQGVNKQVALEQRNHQTADDWIASRTQQGEPPHGTA